MSVLNGQHGFQTANMVWNRVGAYFAHQRGEGGTLILDAFPVNGRVVLLPPKAEEAE